jgi:hypothetical protein
MPGGQRLPPLSHVNVDIEIDVADAGLCRAMRAAFVPGPGAGARIRRAGELQAAPLRQRT